MRRKSITAPDVPRPFLGSHATVAGPFVFVGGQIACDYRSGLPASARRGRGAAVPAVASAQQSAYILEAAQTILRAAGSSFDLGVRIDQFCTHPDAASPYLETRTRYMAFDRRPCSTHVQIDSLLVPGALCGLQLVALTGDSGLTREVDVASAADATSTPGPPIRGSAASLLGKSTGTPKGAPMWIRAGDWVFTTGQLASDFEHGVAPEARPHPDFWYGSAITLQTDYTLRRIAAILAAAGTSLDRVVRADVYLTDMTEAYEVDAVWRTHFRADPPARTFIPLNRLAPRDCRVEINVIALAGSSRLPRRTVTAAGAPRPDLHHPHAVRAGDFLFVSGLYATDFGDGLAEAARVAPEMTYLDSSAKKQTRHILEQMTAICRAGGARLEDVVWTQALYTEPRDVYPSAEVWREAFPDDPPAALVAGVRAPHLIPDCTIMMDAVALAGD